MIFIIFYFLKSKNLNIFLFSLFFFNFYYCNLVSFCNIFDKYHSALILSLHDERIVNQYLIPLFNKYVPENMKLNINNNYINNINKIMDHLLNNKIKSSLTRFVFEKSEYARIKHNDFYNDYFIERDNNDNKNDLDTIIDNTISNNKKRSFKHS